MPSPQPLSRRERGHSSQYRWSCYHLYISHYLASYYGGRFHGRMTASGEIFNQWTRSAAHKSLPLGAKVRVTKLSDGRSIVVRINDRGPFVKGRIIDLSRKAAQDLGIIKHGLAKVKVEVLSLPRKRR
ncbi:septal ring lytic transglycosylase RlpA family protein [Candidatus Thiosymbion oneisti]|uniref:septal ring lytic transglycosylase RlpA family protein n=1 Tax=Candidatus Thiosymbion oneisti TaxID=589554 RepID=UPI000B7F90CC|nr:septal ring lytic transglycosylase RlpA family protein [Candidatus Thiosymbion oneisti]